MKSELFIAKIGEKLITKIKEVSDEIDKLPKKEKAKICSLNDEILNRLIDEINPENHVLAAKSLLVIVKYSQVIWKERKQK